MELEDVFDSQGGGVVQLDLVVRGRDDQVGAIGCDVKDVNVAMGKCRGLLKSKRWLDKARLEGDGNRWRDTVVHVVRVVVKGSLSTVD